MEPLDLIRLQINLEYQVDQEDSLMPFADSSEQACYIVYRHSNGYKAYFNHKLPLDVRQQLMTLGLETAFTHPEKVIIALGDSCQPCKGGEDIFWSGTISRTPNPDEYPEAAREREDWVVMQEGRIVSRAISTRQNKFCAEVYVETLPAYRRKGYGRQVVAAWAQNIRNSGRVPLYSYKLTNKPSAALASSLGVEWYASVVTYQAEY